MRGERGGVRGERWRLQGRKEREREREAVRERGVRGKALQGQAGHAWPCVCSAHNVVAVAKRIMLKTIAASCDPVPTSAQKRERW